MTSQPAAGKPPQAPPPKVKGQGSGGQGYVNRYKLQQQRIRTLNQMEKTAADLQKRLPKITTTGPDKENLVIRAVQRSNTIDVIKLPGVKAAHPSVAPPGPTMYKRKSLPMKTYHLRVNPDHTSFISKSVPSLPSIPGSPSLPEERVLSPLTDRAAERARTRGPVFASKHRFEKIVFQKHLHREPTEFPKDGQGHEATTGARHARGTGHEQHVLSEEKPHTSGSVRLRYSRAPTEAVISETQSEPGVMPSRKWKDDCRCLRCQMLRRQYREGDSHYGLWGRYPCHPVDPSVVLDD